MPKRTCCLEFQTFMPIGVQNENVLTAIYSRQQQQQQQRTNSRLGRRKRSSSRHCVPVCVYHSLIEFTLQKYS